MKHYVSVDSEEYRSLLLQAEELKILKLKMADNAERMDMLTAWGKDKAIFVTADGLECMVRNPSSEADEWPMILERPIFSPYPSPTVGDSYPNRPSLKRTYLRTSDRIRGIPIFMERR